jgi:exonuclease SbcD
MIRLLHTADLHLGVDAYGRLDPATGLSTRVADCLASLDLAVEAALTQGVDLFLFKNREPSQTHQREFAKRIARLANAGVAVFLVVGNHDLPNALGRATAVEIFDTLAIRNVYVASKPGTYRVETRHGPLQIVALPWATRSHLLAREEYKNRTIEEVNRLVEDKLDNILKAEVKALDPSLPAILAGHLTLSEALPGSEVRMTIMRGRDPIMFRSSLANPAFAYVALGHIHRHQVLNAYPPMVYAGSLQRLDFGEEKEDKGYVLVTIDTDAVDGAPTANGTPVFTAHFQFVPVPARRFLTIEVNAEADDPTAAVLKELARHEIREAVVRLVIRISAAREGLLRDGEILRALREAHYSVLSKDVKREYRLRLGGRAAEELGPLEALEAYLAAKKTPPERVKTLLEYAGRLIGEES